MALASSRRRCCQDWYAPDFHATMKLKWLLDSGDDVSFVVQLQITCR